jgi:hypothetical protein
VNKKLKTMKKNPTTILIFLIILAAGVFYYISRSKKPQDILSMRTKTIFEDTNLYKIRAEYPQFDQVTQGFNREIESFVTDRVAQFKKNNVLSREMRKKIISPDKPMPSTNESPWPFNLTWSAQQLNTRYISLMMRVDSFEGGANEVQEIKTFNYDLTKKKPITLVDLFPGKPDYLKMISDYTKKDLTEKFISQDIPTDFVASGTQPKEENFSRFVFDDNKIIFYFPKYQVAPGVAGEQMVIMYF